MNDGFDLSAPGSPEHLDGKEVSANFFSTLGMQPAFGRSFLADEDKIGGAPAAVISNRVAQERFGGGPAALGKTLALNGVDYTVVGVLKPGFRFDERQAEVFTPIARRNPMFISDRTVHDYLCIARLRPEVGVGQALAEMNTVQENIDELHPNTERGLGEHCLPAQARTHRRYQRNASAFVGSGWSGPARTALCERSESGCWRVPLHEFARTPLWLSMRRQAGEGIAWQVVHGSPLLSLTGALFGLAIAKWGVRVGVGGGDGDPAAQRKYRPEYACRSICSCRFRRRRGPIWGYFLRSGVLKRMCKAHSKKGVVGWRVDINGRNTSW